MAEIVPGDMSTEEFMSCMDNKHLFNPAHKVYLMLNQDSDGTLSSTTTLSKGPEQVFSVRGHRRDGWYMHNLSRNDNRITASRTSAGVALAANGPGSTIQAHPHPDKSKSLIFKIGFNHDGGPIWLSLAADGSFKACDTATFDTLKDDDKYFSWCFS